MAAVTVALARASEHQRTTTSIGTVLALQSVALAERDRRHGARGTADTR
jgi:hypothetical protein